MPRFIETPFRQIPAVSSLAVVALLLLLSAGQAQAATTVYPSGGSGFASGAEGWSPGASSCAIPLLCTPESVYEPATGNPPGSIAAQTKATLNLVGLFRGTETWSSPRFTVPVGAVTGASIRLDRAFSPGGLVSVEPTATYTVSLLDLTTGTSSTPLSEKVTKEDTTFATRSASASVVSSHEYQLSIEATTAQSTLALSVLSGTTALRFDNVGLQVQTAGDGGNGGNGNGANGLTDSRLSSLIQSSLIDPATQRGKRLFVKAKCPAKVGRACRISVQGVLRKGKPATTKRTAKVAKGKTKRLVLKVKPKARATVAKRGRLLFKETVHAGSAKATAFKSLKLIRRG